MKPEQASKVTMRMPTLLPFGEGRVSGEAINMSTRSILSSRPLEPNCSSGAYVTGSDKGYLRFGMMMFILFFVAALWIWMRPQ